jgi:hypothetical protein
MRGSLGDSARARRNVAILGVGSIRWPRVGRGAEGGLPHVETRGLAILSAVLMDRGPGSSPGTGWFLRNGSSFSCDTRLPAPAGASSAPASQTLISIW